MQQWPALNIIAIVFLHPNTIFASENIEPAHISEAARPHDTGACRRQFEGWEQENFLGKCSQSNSCQDGGCCCRLPTTCILPSTVILSPSATVPCPLWTSFEGRAHKGTKRLGDASRVSFVSASHSVIQLYGKLWLTRTTRSPFACLWNLLGGDSKLVKSTD